MRHRRVVLVLTLVGLAACKDHPVSPEMEPQNSILMDSRVDSVNVTSYASHVVNGDWAPAIQAAVNAGKNVFFPAGTYDIKSANAIVIRPVPQVTHRGSVVLPSNTRLHGVGSTSKIVVANLGQAVMDSGHHVFVAYHPTERRENITIENMKFVGSGAWQSQAALGRGGTRMVLWVSRGRQIAFRNNHVEKLGLVETMADWPHASFDTINWTRNVEITGNTGIGKNVHIDDLSKVPAWFHGMLLGYVRGATVSNNHLQGYHSAIQWHGGHAPAYHDGVPGAPKWAQDLHISNNQIHDVEAGIWGSMGFDVRVFDNNPVTRCRDVCLDAEGSDSVRFIANVTSNAGGGVLANFFYSEGVYFAWNAVTQDGSLGNTLYLGKNAHQVTSHIRVHIQNNTFSYTGPTGVGRITKENSRVFTMANNTLNNVVVDMGAPHNGTARILGNVINLDRPTDNLAAIKFNNAVGFNGSPFLHTPVNNGFHLEIAGNQIYNTAAQGYTPGIRSQQGYNLAVQTWIHANRIEGFYNSISVGASSTQPFFRIEGNSRTGRIIRDNTSTSWYLGSNPWIYPTTPDPGAGGPGGPCVPPPGQIVCT